MARERVEKLTQMLDDIVNRFGNAKKRDLAKDKRMIERLDSFAPECEKCESLLNDIENKANQWAGKQEALSTEEWKSYEDSFAAIRSHLQKEHDLVEKGYYQGVYLSIGLGVGVLFGLTIFDNIGVGIGLGLALGVSIGAGKDADAKKKGMTL